VCQNQSDGDIDFLQSVLFLSPKWDALFKMNAFMVCTKLRSKQSMIGKKSRRPLLYKS
jgi:hypothetical protein